VVEIVH